MRVLVLTEYYPRLADPVRGVWAHRQTLATHAAGAEVRVLVLHRPVPPLAALRHVDLRTIAGELRQPARAELDGLSVEYLRYLSPPRPVAYGSWGAWAAPMLRRRLAGLRREFPFDLVHAHYAIPAGDALRRAAPEVPLVVSVHGHDVFGATAGSPAVARVLRHARLVLANSAGTARRCSEAGATAVRVVHLGSDPPAAPSTPPPSDSPLLVTVAHLAPRKRHGDVIDALRLLRERYPGLRYRIVGGGPARPALEAQVARLGLQDRVEFAGALPPAQAVAAGREASLFVMPSVEEAFGVAYVEAMGAGVPAIGCRGEAGPEEIAAAGGGITLVPPRDPSALARAIDRILSDRALEAQERAAARATVLGEFTWARCGQATLAALRESLPSPDRCRPLPPHTGAKGPGPLP